MVQVRVAAEDDAEAINLARSMSTYSGTRWFDLFEGERFVRIGKDPAATASERHLRAASWNGDGQVDRSLAPLIAFPRSALLQIEDDDRREGQQDDPYTDPRASCASGTAPQCSTVSFYHKRLDSASPAAGKVGLTCRLSGLPRRSARR